MPRSKITDIGFLKVLEDGGLVCTVTVLQAPQLDASILAASLLPSAEIQELAVGDLVMHPDHGIARYCGRQVIAKEAHEYLVLEFAGADRLFVPVEHTDMVRPITNTSGVSPKLSPLGGGGGKWSRSYCLEAVPNAYEWPGLGRFPERTQELTPEATQEWRRACGRYLEALHASPGYRQAAEEYHARQQHEPQPLLDWWVYRLMVVRVELIQDEGGSNQEEQFLLIKQHVLRRQRSIEKMRREIEALERLGKGDGPTREPIPESVRLFVWRRDKGQCVQCGSRERLEFDHIIPIVAGGGNTDRNLQLLCESCNRSKSSSI
jgi:5-methylcytosine-specific restriction endonuclease McrA